MTVSERSRAEALDYERVDAREGDGAGRGDFVGWLIVLWGVSQIKLPSPG